MYLGFLWTARTDLSAPSYFDMNLQLFKTTKKIFFF